jgi:hypothetical protein
VLLKVRLVLVFHLILFFVFFTSLISIHTQTTLFLSTVHRCARVAVFPSLQDCSSHSQLVLLKVCLRRCLSQSPRLFISLTDCAVKVLLAHRYLAH